MEAEAAEAVVVMAVFKIHTHTGVAQSLLFFLPRKLFIVWQIAVFACREKNQGRSRSSFQIQFIAAARAFIFREREEGNRSESVWKIKGFG